MACLVNDEYDVYDGDGGIKIDAFCSIAAILGSMASSLFMTCSKRQCIAWIDSGGKRNRNINSNINTHSSRFSIPRTTVNYHVLLIVT